MLQGCCISLSPVLLAWPAAQLPMPEADVCTQEPIWSSWGCSGPGGVGDTVVGTSPHPWAAPAPSDSGTAPGACPLLPKAPCGAGVAQTAHSCILAQDTRLLLSVGLPVPPPSAQAVPCHWHGPGSHHGHSCWRGLCLLCATGRAHSAPPVPVPAPPSPSRSACLQEPDAPDP